MRGSKFATLNHHYYVLEGDYEALNSLLGLEAYISTQNELTFIIYVHEVCASREDLLSHARIYTSVCLSSVQSSLVYPGHRDEG